MELYLGTGGFSYPYWKGIFYPPGLKPRDYLWHYARLFAAVEPLEQAGALGPFVAQFPYSFHRTPTNRHHLLEVVRRFAGQTLAVELRHASWAREPVWEAFREQDLVWVSGDYPPLAGLPQSGPVVTAPVAYLRLMGRNAAKWWDHEEREERYDYLYTPEELRPYARTLAGRAGELREAWVVFHNTPRGQALVNLGTFKELLEELGLEPAIDLPGLG